MQSLGERLQAALNEARKSRDQARTLLFSTILADLKNREFALHHPLSDDEGLDVVRRGIVMQTSDELTNIRMIFQEGAQPGQAPGAGQQSASATDVISGKPPIGKERTLTILPSIETEAQALSDLSAMPIYFASSYSLVKPYVTGFDANVLDAPSLKTVRINTSWKQQASSSPLGNR